MKSRRLALSILALPLTALVLAGCTQGAAQLQPGSEDPGDGAGIEVVATTNVYRDIAQSIGGEHVQATEIISSTAQDPHSYEPSARDKLAVSNAQLVLANGGGYDDFMTQLVSSLPEDSRAQTVYAVDSSPVPGESDHAQDSTDHQHAGEDHAHEGHDHDEEGHEGHDHAGYNEHIWFDLESMSALAGELAEQFAALDPEHADVFEANAGEFAAQIEQLAGQLESAGLQGRSFAMTEPVPYHLLVDAGMVDATPEGLSAAVESGSDIPPQILKQLNDALASGSIDLLAYNIQTEGADSISIRATAEAGSVPVVEFAETMDTDQHYVQWMAGHINALSEVMGH